MALEANLPECEPVILMRWNDFSDSRSSPSMPFEHRSHVQVRWEFQSEHASGIRTLEGHALVIRNQTREPSI